jgi:hypothetical protein
LALEEIALDCLCFSEIASFFQQFRGDGPGVEARSGTGDDKGRIRRAIVTMERIPSRVETNIIGPEVIDKRNIRNPDGIYPGCIKNS